MQYCGLIWNAKIRGNERLIVRYTRNRNQIECTYIHFRSQYNFFFFFFMWDCCVEKKRGVILFLLLRRPTTTGEPAAVYFRFPFRCHFFFFAVAMYLCSLYRCFMLSLNRTGRHYCCITFFFKLQAFIYSVFTLAGFLCLSGCYN